MFRTVIFGAVVFLAGCTKREQDFAWFAAEVAVAVAQTANSATTVEGGTGVAEAAPDPDSYPPPSQADLQRAHDMAMQLTQIAAHDARTEHCEAVVSTSQHVRVIDADVFVNVFLKDPPIQRCLAIAP